ncbi:L-type lectin-domain containing receptor kinase IX.1-like [Castanea sativa]|uniref:L-type lectin-domain containing receptor kinase IX.1-like n=1 Tax=Castanea sativa TaxID=21020 RepID=UPI003F650575
MVFQALKLRIIYLLISIFLLLINPCATRIFFNYTDFSQTINNKPIIRTGNATISGSVIQLTPDEVDNWGRAIYSEQMHLWDEKSEKVASFTSNFSFIINSQGKDRYSDGITFFLSTPNYPVPSPTDGAGLGLLSRNQMNDATFLAANKFVAVEFDTFPNEEFDPLNSVREHVGININNLKSQISTPWYCTIKENRTYSARINYDSSTQNLSVTFTGFNYDNTIIQQHLSLVINLTDHLPESVEFGFSASTGLISELHILSTWSFESPSPSTIQQSPAPSVEKSKDEPKTKLVVGLSLGASILSIGLVLVCFLYRKKCREGKGEKEEELGFVLSMDNEFERGTGPKKFSYNELVSATSNFAEENKLGQGGFGGVYKGYLRVINSYVAIKRVSRGSAQGIKEYISEVRSISRLKHRNLVQLIGWCHEKNDLLLIYEFMSNGSLDLHLFKGKSLLTWVERYNIARGLASVLRYLHEEWEQCVLHRDIKSSNILLDSNLNAKLGDFGLARLVDHVKGSQTTMLAGTMGYLAPECIMSGRASKETDVYSFGVVALEIACGRKPVEPNAKQDEIIMLEWVWELYGARNLLKAADPRLGGDFDEQQMERLMVVGLWCAHPDYNARPSIRKAIHVLDFEVTLPILEPKLPVPTFLTPPIIASTSSISKSENHYD